VDSLNNGCNDYDGGVAEGIAFIETSGQNENKNIIDIKVIEQHRKMFVIIMTACKGDRRKK
jgi:hypothetical protein